MHCSYCNRSLKNKGLLTLHEKRCKENPNRIPGKRSPLAGVKHGNIPWNKGITFEEESLARTINIIESKAHLSLHEVTAREHAKKYLVYKNGHACSICHNVEWNNLPIPLICDHINGDSTDNRIENFRLVCCNCDAQLPTYKSKNKNGRKYDREYRRKKMEG